MNLFKIMLNKIIEKNDQLIKKRFTNKKKDSLIKKRSTNEKKKKKKLSR